MDINGQKKADEKESGTWGREVRKSESRSEQKGRQGDEMNFGELEENVNLRKAV